MRLSWRLCFFTSTIKHVAYCLSVSKLYGFVMPSTFKVPALYYMVIVNCKLKLTNNNLLHYHEICTQKQKHLSAGYHHEFPKQSLR